MHHCTLLNNRQLQIIITFVVGNWGLHAAHYNKADCIEHLQPWVLTQPLMPALSL
jgi:hypothetical protein